MVLSRREGKSFSQNVLYCVSGEVTAALSQMFLCLWQRKAGYIENFYNVLLSTTVD